jgi:hypothetical protein
MQKKLTAKESAFEEGAGLGAREEYCRRREVARGGGGGAGV